MNELQKDKKIALPTDLVNKIKETIAIFCVNQNETLEVMANAFKSHSCIFLFILLFRVLLCWLHIDILDPHSAIGVKGAQLYSASQNDKTHITSLFSRIIFVFVFCILYLFIFLTVYTCCLFVYSPPSQIPRSSSTGYKCFTIFFIAFSYPSSSSRSHGTARIQSGGWHRWQGCWQTTCYDYSVLLNSYK